MTCLGTVGSVMVRYGKVRSGRHVEVLFVGFSWGNVGLGKMGQGRRVEVS